MANDYDYRLLSEIQRPDVVGTEKLRDYYKTGIYPVIGTQTAATSSWTGALHGVPALYNGLTIMYYLPWAGVSSATLNLTLDDGTTTGAVNCYYSTTQRVSTHYAKGTNIVMTYWSAGSITIDGVQTTDNRWIVNGNYNTNSDTIGYDVRDWYNRYVAGSNKIFRNTFIMQRTDDKWESIVTSSSTGTTKTRNTRGFRFGKLALMNINATYNEDTTIADGNVYNSSTYTLLDARYSFNVVNAAEGGLVAKQPVYLVGTLNNNDNLFYLDETWWTQTLPSTEDGKLYIYLGVAYDYYRMTFEIHNPIYHYSNGAVRQFTQDAATVNGLSVQTAVPANAKFTDTTYTGTGAISVNSSTHVISTTAEANQNAFSNVKVGSTTIAADTKTDTLELVAGNNVTLTPDATNDKVTIATTDTNTTYSLTQDSSDGHKITLTPSSGTAQTVTIPDNNTTYTFANGTNGFTVTPSGGTVQTVTVTPSIANNITGSGTSGYLTKFNGTNTVTNGPALGSDTTKFLRNDGTWVVPDNTDTKVTQTSTTNNANYEVLFSGTADNTTRTESARKTNKLKFNPSTELLTVTKEKIAHTAYGVSSGKTTGTPKETILKTGIKWVTGKHMPVVHITGYAYGLKSPVEFKIGFYIYHDVIGWCGVTNMGAWAPDVYLFKYTRDSENYVAIGFAGQCYYLQLQADVQDEMGALEYINLANANWSWEFLTTTGNIPTPDSGVTCIKVPYQANILNPSKVNGHTVETDVPSGAVFTDTWRPTVICENSEAPTGTMLNNERVDYRGGDNVELVYTQEHWTVGSTVHSKDVVTFNSPDTTYTLGTSGNNVTLTPSSGTAQSITTPYATNSKIAGGIVRAVLDDTQTTATSFIATAQGITELYDGLTIIMKNTKIKSAANWVINLNDLGGKAVYNSKTNSRITTAYELNAEYLFVFDYANDYWVMQLAYYEPNSNTIGEHAGSVVADENGAIFDNSIVLQTQLNPPRWSSITTTGGTGTSKQHTSLGFLPNGNIIYATSAASAGETIGQSSAWWLGSNSIRYWTNCGTSTLPATAVGKSIYIKCTMNNGLLYIADAPWWAVDLPTINDGYYYYYVGNMYSRYQCTIAPNHPIYYHNGEKIIEYTDNKVLQTTDSATNSNYPILFSDSTTSDNITSGTKKSSSLYYNPYNQELSLTSLKTYDHLNVDNYAWIDVTTWTKDLYFHRNSNGDTRYIQSIGDDGNGGERTDTLLAITDNNTVIASNLLKKATNEWTFIDETGFDVTGASGIVPVSNYTNYSELMVIVYITNVSSTDCYKGSHIIPLTSGGTLPGPSATECIFGGYYYSSSYLLNYALNCSTSGTTYNISWRDGWFTMKPNPSSDNKYNIKVYAR